MRLAWLRSRRRRWTIAVAVVALIAAAAVLLPMTVLPRTDRSTAPPPPGPGASPAHPNIVYVLTDDLAWNLVPYMPHVLALMRQGMTFTNFSVTDSLCCPSRASILTGDFPHDTGVVSNDPPLGGFDRFTDNGDDRNTIATSLSANGYRTALIGKYLNHYIPEVPVPTPDHGFAVPYVPPGWSTWNGVDGGGYAEYGYTMADYGGVRTYGNAPQDYFTTVAQTHAMDFIDASVADRRPFFLDMATFAPHAPYVPAPTDVGTFPHLREPRDPAFGRTPLHAPPWLAKLTPLRPDEIARIDTDFERRVESVQAVDRLVGALERRVERLHQSRNTIFVFNSDNGYHMGQYNLRPGKMTAFDTDVRVPLVVAGPGIPAGSVCRDAVENIDLRPTFAALAGASTPSNVDGHSFVGLLHGHDVPWRTFALIEHHHPNYAASDPDRQKLSAANPPTYAALRTTRFTYVRYVDGSREYYDRLHDPHELDNVYASLSAARRAALDQRLDVMTTCHGAAACWAAAAPSRE